jgi:hypothetical protein
LLDTSTRCPGDAIAAGRLKWHLSSNPSVSGGSVMTYDSGTTSLSGNIATQPASSVILYQVEVDFGDGGKATFPTSTTYYTLTVRSSVADGGQSDGGAGSDGGSSDSGPGGGPGGPAATPSGGGCSSLSAESNPLGALFPLLLALLTLMRPGRRHRP